MSVVKTQKISSSLTHKGFQAEQTHHEMFWLFYNNKRTSIRTRISHGEKEYNDSLLGLMARQLGLSRNELNDLIECPLDKENYLKLLIERGYIIDSDS